MDSPGSTGDVPIIESPVQSSRLVEFFTHLFDPSGFPKRWECGRWPAEVGWLHIVSDIAIFAAYAAIPASLLIFILRRRDVPIRALLFLFVGFILSCGITHLVDASMFYYPAYRFLGLMKLITAIVSLTTVVALVRVLPKALTLPRLAEGYKHAQIELAQQRQSEDEWTRLRQQLEQRGSELTVRDHRFRKAMLAAAAGAASWNIATGEFDWEISICDLMSEYTDSKPMARGWNELLSARNAELLQEAGMRAIRDRNPLIIDLTVTAKSGEVRTLRVRATCEPEIPGEAPIMNGMVGFTP